MCAVFCYSVLTSDLGSPVSGRLGTTGGNLCTEALPAGKPAFVCLAIHANILFICGQRHRRYRSADVRPSVCLALPQGSCRVPYQYRGHLSHKKSLVAFFRQVMMINRDKIVRFGEKFGKKIFATTFFRTEICPCPSEIKKSPSVKFLRAAGQFLSKVAHVTCLDQ